MSDPGAGESIAAAELDSQIDAVLAGRPPARVDPGVVWLAAAVRTDPPAVLAGRVSRAQAREWRRAWRPVRYPAAVLAYLFFSQGLGNFFTGPWVARNLGEDYGAHAFTEGGFALMAAGVAIAAGVVSRRFLPLSVAVGVMLALPFGAIGVTELDEFAAGAALHLSQGVAGVVLAVSYWRLRR